MIDYTKFWEAISYVFNERTGENQYGIAFPSGPTTHSEKFLTFLRGRIFILGLINMISSYF